MRIGVDIDNVIADFNGGLFEAFLLHDKELRNTGIINSEKYMTRGMFDWSEKEIRDFYNKNIERIAHNLKPIEEASKYINMLRNDGHKIIIITGRKNGDYSDPYNMTITWLKNNFIEYDDLIFTNVYNSSEKANVCVENHIDIMIDDARGICREIERKNIKSLLMNTKFNNNATNFTRVYSWKEIYNYVTNYSNERLNVILDTDMYNEIDDQFALTYLMSSLDRFNVQAITIAPFLKSGYANIDTIEEGIEKSYETTLKILDMIDMPKYKQFVYKGATYYTHDKIDSNLAVDKIIEIALKNERTTIIAIGAITNIALAIIKEPKIVDKIEVVWLGGNSPDLNQNDEFNFRQDIKAVRIVFESKVNLTVIPCRGVASHMITTIYELEHYLCNSDIGEFLCNGFRNLKNIIIKIKKMNMAQAKFYGI